MARQEQAPIGSASIDFARLDTVVLARLAAGGDAGLPEQEVVRSLQPMVAHRLTPAEWRSVLQTSLARLLAAGEADGGGVWRLADAGAARRATTLPGNAHGKANASRTAKGAPIAIAWPTMRNRHLVAAALGLDELSPTRAKLLDKAEGLRALVLEQAFALRLRGMPTPARVRSALAGAALERAFGHKLKSQLGAGGGLSAKAGRLLAGQLARTPRDFGTDARLVAALAAEQLGAAQADEESLRITLLRRFVTKPTAAAPNAQPAAPKPSPAATITAPANDAGRAVPAAARAGVGADARVGTDTLAGAAIRPDLDRFTSEVQAAARLKAEGWPGARKAYISHVYEALAARRPEWRLTAIEFKGMLAEAHRAGRLVLANVDLKDRSVLREMQESALPYKNTVWHQIRVED